MAKRFIVASYLKAPKRANKDERTYIKKNVVLSYLPGL